MMNLKTQLNSLITQAFADCGKSKRQIALELCLPSRNFLSMLKADTTLPFARFGSFATATGVDVQALFVLGFQVHEPEAWSFIKRLMAITQEESDLLAWARGFRFAAAKTLSPRAWPDGKDRVAAFVACCINDSGKTQAEISTRMRYKKQSPVLSLLKSGQMKMPLARIESFCQVTSGDPIHLLHLCLKQYSFRNWQSAHDLFVSNILERDVLVAFRAGRSKQELERMLAVIA